MLKIASSKQLVDSMRLAKETGTEDQLIHWLLYLDTWGGDCIVEIVPDIPYDAAYMSWMAFHKDENGNKKEEPFYNGGLVYHESSKQWGVHS
jgi:hypothetical protein